MFLLLHSSLGEEHFMVGYNWRFFWFYSRSQDSALSAIEREVVAFQCLQLTANHFRTNRNVLKQVVSISAFQTVRISLIQ